MLRCLKDHVELGPPAGSVDLSTGDWLYLEEGEPHSVQGIERASLLLTIPFDP